MMQGTSRDITHDTPWQSGKWIVSARWYYLTFALCFALSARGSFTFDKVTLVLLAIYAFALLVNAYFLSAFWSIANETHEAKLKRVNVAQIALDLVYFTVMLLSTGGGAMNAGHVFFFVPIIFSTIALGSRETMLVAGLSGVAVIAAELLAFFGPSVNETGGALHSAFSTLAIAVQSLAIIAIYFLSAFFGSYLARLIYRRDLLLRGEIAKGQEQVKRLEALTEEFDRGAKLLVRRDLELSNANDKLTELDKMKSEVISVVAHQLRTPLSAIKWTIKMLIDGDAGSTSSEQRDLLAKGFESNERMITLVNDMLAVERLESGKLKYHFIPVQFEGLIEEMIGNLLPIATHKRIQIEFKSPKERLPKIKVDPDKIRDVLQNLLDNAIKYTKDGGHVNVGLAQEGTELHFWVKDDGIGIPEDAKGRIFSRFFRAPNALATETDGSGLGLFIAQSVVKRHGGKIWFSSAMNEGTTFHVSLPLSP